MQRRFFRIGETANGLLQLLYSKTAESSMGDGVRGTIALTCVQVGVIRLLFRGARRETERASKVSLIFNSCPCSMNNSHCEQKQSVSETCVQVIYVGDQRKRAKSHQYSIAAHAQ